MKKTRRSRYRSTRISSGATLTEMLVATVLLAVILAALGEIMTLCAYSTVKLTSLTDVRIGIRPALERIKADVKQSYEIDSALSNASRLVLHRPNFYLNPKNNPLSTEYDANAPQDPLNGTPTGYADRIEYKVEADVTKPNEFVLKFNPTTTNQVVAKGIIGPLGTNDDDQIPDVFVYLKRQSDGAGKVFVTEANAVDAFHGVAIDLEVRRPISDTSDPTIVDPRYDSTMGVRGEAFTRFNRMGSRISNG